jgi:hypothetical protein
MCFYHHDFHPGPPPCGSDSEEDGQTIEEDAFSEPQQQQRVVEDDSRDEDAGEAKDDESESDDGRDERRAVPVGHTQEPAGARGGATSLGLQLPLTAPGLGGLVKREAATAVSFERVLEDFVVLTFLAGNDFLPNVPSISLNDMPNGEIESWESFLQSGICLHGRAWIKC